MKNALAAAALMLLSLSAQAQNTTRLECGFTEPFFTLNIDLVKNEISRTEPDWNNGGSGTVTNLIEKGIKLDADLSDVLAPKYKILRADGTVFAEIALDMKGSDGMSDIISPFSIVHDKTYGGCVSDKLDSVNPHY